MASVRISTSKITTEEPITQEQIVIEIEKKKPLTYTVKSGDSLIKIANKYKKITWGEIALKNKIETHIISVGQKLNIPKVGEISKTKAKKLEKKIINSNIPIVSVSNTVAPVGSGSCYDEVLKYDWPISTALKIMTKESGGVASNHNYSDITRDDSWGCFQINIYPPNNLSRPPAEWLVVASNNVKYAYDLWLSQGKSFCTSGGWINSC